MAPFEFYEIHRPVIESFLHKIIGIQLKPMTLHGIYDMPLNPLQCCEIVGNSMGPNP